MTPLVNMKLALCVVADTDFRYTWGVSIKVSGQSIHVACSLKVLPTSMQVLRILTNAYLQQAIPKPSALLIAGSHNYVL